MNASGPRKLRRHTRKVFRRFVKKTPTIYYHTPNIGWLERSCLLGNEYKPRLSKVKSGAVLYGNMRGNRDFVSPIWKSVIFQGYYSTLRLPEETGKIYPTLECTTTDRFIIRLVAYSLHLTKHSNSCLSYRAVVPRAIWLSIPSTIPVPDCNCYLRRPFRPRHESL